MTIMCILILFTDLNNIIAHYLWIILVFCIFQHPSLKTMTGKISEKFSLWELNPDYKAPLLFTKEEWDFL